VKQKAKKTKKAGGYMWHHSGPEEDSISDMCDRIAEQELDDGTTVNVYQLVGTITTTNKPTTTFVPLPS
jgi:hypothetical protein